MPLPKSLTTVTTFSKLVALGMFVALPFIGFYYGLTYTQNTLPYPPASEEVAVEIKSDFEKMLTDDLVKHPELIPYEAVLGGTMGFYHKDMIEMLEAPWVSAYFGDGHISGYLLLKYEITDQENISWEVIDSKIN